MIGKFFKVLLLGALRPQRGDAGNLHWFRSVFWVSLSTALYLTSALQALFTKQYLAFRELEGTGLFSLQNFDGSALTILILTLGLFAFFLFAYPNVLADYREAKNRGAKYSLFLLYFLPSFVIFLLSQGHYLGYSFLVS